MFEEGTNITITGIGSAVNPFVISSSAAGLAGHAGHIIEDEGAALAQRATLNFVGDSVVATDDAGSNETDVTINHLATAIHTVAQPLTVRKNTGADVGTRPRINLIEGANITLTVADDAGSNEVDITIAAASGGGAPAEPTFYAATGAAQTYIVPAGVTKIEYELAGGAGGFDLNDIGRKGAGSTVKGLLTVTPAESLQINVGGAGTDGVTGVSGPGGFNGGGTGARAAGGGGGGTDIRQGGTALANRVAVAGGGGGAGANSSVAFGGDSAFTEGFVGGEDAASTSGNAGKGGTQAAGGAGGTGGGTGVDGSAGTSGVGGAGGAAGDAADRGGGGGGGGFFGGGGGEGGQTAANAGGGGGGGACLATGSGSGFNIGPGWARILPVA